MDPEADPSVTMDPQTLATPNSVEDFREEIADWAAQLSS